jgi:hypothetical protein
VYLELVVAAPRARVAHSIPLQLLIFVSNRPTKKKKLLEKKQQQQPYA